MTSSKLTSVEVLERALELFGPDGERWANKSPIGDEHCSVTALAKIAVLLSPSYMKAKSLVRRGAGLKDSESLSYWNDAHTFPEVRAAFLKAIELAKAEQEAAHV